MAEPKTNVDPQELFSFAVKSGASDVLITAGTPPCLRIHGVLNRVDTPDLTPDDTRRIVYSVLTPEQIQRFEKERELDFAFTAAAGQRFRGNGYMQRGSVAGAFRLVPQEIPGLEQLGLPALLHDLALSPQGLLLVTGPTGQGKTTTQACLIDIVNTNRRLHVVTIEDPIEYVHRNKRSVVDQREVGADTTSFRAALRHVLREDPDVILIGEMRDLETVAAALTAAETGHLVIATLHTNDAVQAIDRIIDVFPAHQQEQVRTQLAFSLLAVVSQRLLPRAGGKGRVAAVEILRSNTAVSSLIREDKTHQIYSVMETHAKDGMISMDAALLRLCRRGVIEREEARVRMRNPKAIEEL
jgi:twitching motility protein PilT